MAKLSDIVSTIIYFIDVGLRNWIGHIFFYHIVTSIDRKITGAYMDKPEGKKSQDIFYNIAFGSKPYYRHQGWLSACITTDDNFTFYAKSELNKSAPTVPEDDFVAESDASKYYLSIDPSGTLGWKTNELV